MRGSDHRVRVTKLLIRKALTQLLMSKPIQSISIKELCQQAGINRGTFYAHYSDIYQLRQQMEDEMLEEFQQVLKPLLEQGNKVPPLQVTTRIFQCLRDNADVCAMTFGPYGDKTFAVRMIDVSREKYEQCYYRYFKDVTPQKLEYYYTFVSAGCMGMVEKWLNNGLNPSAEELAAIVEGIMMHGIGFLGQEETSGRK